MKTLSISGTARKNTGIKDSTSLRKNGQVPCVLYGGKEQVFFAVDEKQFSKLLYTPDAYLVTIDLGGKQTSAIVQEAQFDKVTDQLLHVDFLEAVPGKTLTVKIPVVTHGSPKGVKMGGKLQVKIRRVTVKGLVQDIPDHLTLEVEHLELGESILVKDVDKKMEKLKFLDPANAAIITVRTTREIEVPTAATAAVGAPVTTAAAPAAAAAAGAPAAAGATAPAAAGAAKKEEKPAAAKK
ncbi:MAG: 50S ribosomal protein L25 [Bacteroidia bacterium]